MNVRDISIVKYNGFCCLQKFNVFPKIEYHSLFSDLFISMSLLKMCDSTFQNTRSVFDNKNNFYQNFEMYEYLETFWSIILLYCEFLKKITCNENCLFFNCAKYIVFSRYV